MGVEGKAPGRTGASAADLTEVRGGAHLAALLRGHAPIGPWYVLSAERIPAMPPSASGRDSRGDKQGPEGTYPRRGR